MSQAILLPAQLPPLRQDLQLHPAAPHADGSPSWLIQDPVGNQFYRIGWLEFELLARWELAQPQAVVAATARETPLAPALTELGALFNFLLENQLLAIHDPQYTRSLLVRSRASRPGSARWLLHHYLFFRVPLLHPGRALGALAQRLAWVFTPGFLLALAACGALGLLLVARQWDSFLASFRDSLSPAGVLAYLLALALSKSLHELGHALVATRLGLRVAHMGVAFVVMWPMLYTDTGETWRLKDSRQRLAISSAGILTELGLAALATLGWSLAGPGPLKEALFFLATTAWFLSLALNLSPFMRFDGYFILSDLVDMPNLHERAFALARAALRRTLLGWAQPDPEPFAAGPRRLLIAFAWVTWLYRLSVFFAIALAVYHWFFKLLGIVLFAVEIGWFIVLPIWREWQAWRAGPWRLDGRRRLLWGAAGAVLLGLALIPWSRQVEAPAWVRPARMHTFYSPLPARLDALPREGEVAAGQALFQLRQPELGFRADAAQAGAEALADQLRGLAGVDQGEARREQLTSQMAQQEAELQAQQAEAARLVLRAPFAGRLVDLDPDLAPGVWVGPRTPLAVLVAPGEWQAEVFVHQQDLARLAAGAAVRLYPAHDRLRPLRGHVLQIEQTRLARLPASAMSAHFGGPLAVLPEGDGLTPRDALYRVRVALDEAPPGLALFRGEAAIEARAESWLVELLKPALVVLVRELSF